VNVRQAGFADTVRLSTVLDKSVLNKPCSQEVQWHYQIIRMTRASTAPTSNKLNARLWTLDCGLEGPKLSGPRGADCVVVSVCCVCVRQSRARDEGGTREPPEDQRRLGLGGRSQCKSGNGCGALGLARCSVALEKDPCERFKSGPPSDSSNLHPAIFPREEPFLSSNVRFHARHHNTSKASQLTLRARLRGTPASCSCHGR
jgi:hypothetical protein